MKSRNRTNKGDYQILGRLGPSLQWPEEGGAGGAIHVWDASSEAAHAGHMKDGFCCALSPIPQRCSS